MAAANAFLGNEPILRQTPGEMPIDRDNDGNIIRADAARGNCEQIRRDIGNTTASNLQQVSVIRLSAFFANNPEASQRLVADRGFDAGLLTTLAPSIVLFTVRNNPKDAPKAVWTENDVNAILEAVYHSLGHWGAGRVATKPDVTKPNGAMVTVGTAIVQATRPSNPRPH